MTPSRMRPVPLIPLSSTWRIRVKRWGSLIRVLFSSVHHEGRHKCPRALLVFIDPKRWIEFFEAASELNRDWCRHRRKEMDSAMVLVPCAEFVEEFAYLVPEHFEPFPGCQEVTAGLSRPDLIDKRFAPQGCLHPRVDDWLAYGEYQCNLLPSVGAALRCAHLVERPRLFLLSPCPILPVPMALVQVYMMQITQKRAEMDQ